MCFHFEVKFKVLLTADTLMVKPDHLKNISNLGGKCAKFWLFSPLLLINYKRF